MPKCVFVIAVTFFPLLISLNLQLFKNLDVLNECQTLEFVLLNVWILVSFF